MLKIKVIPLFSSAGAGCLWEELFINFNPGYLYKIPIFIFKRFLFVVFLLISDIFK